jgi:hypothetical protein
MLKSSKEISPILVHLGWLSPQLDTWLAKLPVRLREPYHNIAKVEMESNLSDVKNESSRVLTFNQVNRLSKNSMRSRSANMGLSGDSSSIVSHRNSM